MSSGAMGRMPSSIERSRDVAAEALAALRARPVRVHAITNTVVQGFTANMLLAAGAVPSMTTDAEEVADFVAGADALLVNLGTLDAERRRAVDAALAVGRPWVLDPVLVERTRRRAALARDLVVRRPSVLRLNPAEFAALAGRDADPEAFSRDNRLVLALTGAVDVITDGVQTVRLANGHPWLAMVTGAGCATSAIVAALLGATGDPFAAALAGLALVGIAGEMAAERSAGPGSFAVALVDAVAALEPAMLADRLKLVP